MTALDDWNALNERQRAYLRTIYTIDQEDEAYERGRYARGQRSRLADEWRWLSYSETRAELRQRLLRQKLVDPGAGSTFEALEQRGFIQCRHEMGVFGDLLYVRMTPKGRRVVRAGTGAERPARLPTGTLQEWHWQAMARAYAAYPDGIEGTGAGRYGDIQWNTWLRLRDYSKGDLIENYSVQVSTWPEWISQSYVRLTPFGVQYYEREWARYRELYPDVQALEPAGKSSLALSEADASGAAQDDGGREPGEVQ